MLGRLRSAIAKQASWQSRDQAWLVVDTDRWTEAEKRKIEQEIEGDSRIHLASSNPCFELWLLLHFRHAWDSVTSADLERALNSPDCFGSYTKENYDAQSLMERVKDAIDRARQADHSLPDKWTAPGETHVYRVVEKIREIHS